MAIKEADAKIYLKIKGFSWEKRGKNKYYSLYYFDKRCDSKLEAWTIDKLLNSGLDFTFKSGKTPIVIQYDNAKFKKKYPGNYCPDIGQKGVGYDVDLLVYIDGILIALETKGSLYGARNGWLSQVYIRRFRD